MLAALALIAGLYHTINHAIFKALLFLGAGAVLHATHTRNMEEMGGLIRRMPSTAFCFLIGAVAISGLPPLNGFVSEWLTYQALLAGFGTTGSLARLMFPIAGAHAGADGRAGRGLFREGLRDHLPGAAAQRRRPRRRTKHALDAAGMGMLAVAVSLLGFGATWFLPVFDPLTAQLLGTRVSRNLVAAAWLRAGRGHAHGGTVSTVGHRA